MFTLHFHIILYYLLTYLLLLQNASKYPEAHPLSQCPLVELQLSFAKQFPLQCLLQSIPNFPFSQPVVNNINILYNKTDN